MSMNDKLIEIAISEHVVCEFYLRRIHNVIGIPQFVEPRTHRLYVELDSGELISVTLGEISYFKFPAIVMKKFNNGSDTTKQITEPKPVEKIDNKKLDKKIVQSYSIDLQSFIKDYHYSDLTYKELAEKINVLSNKTLKENWLVQLGFSLSDFKTLSSEESATDYMKRKNKEKEDNKK